MEKLRCVGKDCCKQVCSFAPKSGITVETDQGALVVRVVLYHHLRMPYGMQPRELWWEISGTLNGRPVECELRCQLEVRSEVRPRLKPGDHGFYEPRYSK